MLFLAFALLATALPASAATILVFGDSLSAGYGLPPQSGWPYLLQRQLDALERRLAALEGGVGAVAVSSGMAAVSYALMCAGEGGGRIIAPTNLYGASVDADRKSVV